MSTMSNAKKSHSHRNLMLALAAGSLLGFGGTARADVKIVEQITSPSRGGQETQTVTAYFHGDSLRLENDKGAVTLIDTTAGKAYNIDVANKAYNERSLPPTPAAPPPDAPAATLKVNDAGTSSSVAGEKAEAYTISGTATMGPPPGRRGDANGNAAGGPPAGGPGNGDQPGPPQGGPDGASPAGQGPGQPQTATVSGQYQLTGDLATALTSTATLRPYLDLVAGPIGHEGADALLSQIETAKLFPLDAAVTATQPGPNGESRTLKFTTTVQSVSTADLDASLFTVPSDYTKVTTRITGVGGRGGQRQRPQQQQN